MIEDFIDKKIFILYGPYLCIMSEKFAESMEQMERDQKQENGRTELQVRNHLQCSLFLSLSMVANNVVYCEKVIKKVSVFNVLITEYLV